MYEPGEKVPTDVHISYIPQLPEDRNVEKNYYVVRVFYPPDSDSYMDTRYVNVYVQINSIQPVTPEHKVKFINTMKHEGQTVLPKYVLDLLDTNGDPSLRPELEDALPPEVSRELFCKK